jgi:6-phosphogluconolactonase
MRLRLASALVLLLAVLTPLTAAPKAYFVFFGTYNKAGSEGIYRSRFDLATGRFGPVELAARAKDPAFLALHPNGKFLYAIDESSSPKTAPDAGLTAYALNPANGALKFLNQLSAGDSGPCHLAVDATGKSVLVANYGGGSVSAVTLKTDGRLGALGSVVKHTGSSVNAARQKSPHAHGVYLSADNRFAFVPDLGTDRVLSYVVDPATAKLKPNPVLTGTALKPGSGPRHLAFHPDGKFAYVISELLCTVTVMAYSVPAGTLTTVQTISTLPPRQPIPAGTSTAEIQVHPNGKFLYGSNRGANTIVVYTISPTTGQLAYLESVATLGQTPRHFALDPTGTWLLAENQDSNTVAVFRIDQKTGRLTPTGPLLSVPSPVAAVFVPVP